MRKSIVAFTLGCILALTSGAAAGVQSVDAVAAATVNNKVKITSCVPTSNSVTIVWTTRYNVASWTLTLTPTGGSPTTRLLTSSEVSAKSLTATGLASSTGYTIRIEQNPGAQLDGYTAAAGSTTFTTLAGSTPLALTAPTNISETSATISWTGGSADYGYITVYDPFGTAVIDNALTAGNMASHTVVLENLSAATEYSVEVTIGDETQLQTIQTLPASGIGTPLTKGISAYIFQTATAIRMSIPTQSTAVAGLYQANGTCVATVGLTASAGMANGYLPISGVAAGTYLLRIATPAGTTAKSIVIRQ